MPTFKLLNCQIAKLLNWKKQYNNVTIQQFNNGFTLIELLVVIAILGILASVTIASYGQTQERARDSRRKTDLDALKKALELARQDTPGAYYYPGCDSGSNCSLANTNSNPDLAPTYIKTVPADPKTNTGYLYTPTPGSCTTKCTSYSLIACLENTSDPQKDVNQDETACPGAPVNYTITPN